MIKALTKLAKAEPPIINTDSITGDLSQIWGDADNIRGDVSNLRGDVGGICGNVSNITGYVSNICGNLDECELTKEDRMRGINIEELVSD